MPRSSQDWRAYAYQVIARMRQAFEHGGLPLPDPLPLRLNGPSLVSYDPGTHAIVLGFPEGDARPAYAFYANLLSPSDEAELERLLELLITRLTLSAVTHLLRVTQSTASSDGWLEEQVGNAVAYAATAQLFEPSRPFLVDVLSRAIANLQQRRLLDLPGSGGERDPALSAEGTGLLYQLMAFHADAQRTDLPSFELTLQALVAASGLAQRRSAESELVLLQTFTDGPPTLRRTAAELFAQEASAEAVAKLLASNRVMPPDVRLKLAAALLERGAVADATDYLTGLATSQRTPPPVAAAAALLLEDPAGFGVNPATMLAELEDSGLHDALRLLNSLPTASGSAAVWPMLQHRSPAVRREAYRLLARVLPEADAWTGAADPEPAIRAASAAMLSPRPGLPRALAQLLLDEDQDVRRQALLRVRSHDLLAQEVGTLLMARENDEGRRAAAAVVADRVPEWSDRILGFVLVRTIKPYTLAVAAAMAADPWNRHLQLVEQLANEALNRQRRDLLSFAADARGRADWIALFEAAEHGQDSEAHRRLSAALPAGWYDALYARQQDFDPLFAMRSLAVSHPEPFVRAAILLWLARSGHDEPEQVAFMAEQDPTQTVAEVAPIVRSASEGTMALTAIEKALFLRTSPLFRSVPTQSLLAVGGAMVVGTHAAGEAIVKQAELGDRLFVLYEGQAEARREGADGTTTTLASLSPGAVFGEMSLFDSEPRSASVVATTTCQTLMLDGQTFHRLGVQYPEILWEVCRVLSQRLRITGQSLMARPSGRGAEAA